MHELVTLIEYSLFHEKLHKKPFFLKEDFLLSIQKRLIFFQTKSVVTDKLYTLLLNNSFILKYFLFPHRKSNAEGQTHQPAFCLQKIYV